MPEIIPVIVACHRERDQVLRLANWIRELGGVKNHDVLLYLTQTAHRNGLHKELEPILTDAFKSYTLYVPMDSVEIPWGHPMWDASSANHAIKRVSIYCEQVLKRPFLWLEADVAPTRKTWLDEICAEYETCGMPFMGDIVNNGVHEIHMSGIAVYPWDLIRYTDKIRNCGRVAWDIHSCKDVVKRAFKTNLIQHSYQQPYQTGCHTWQNGKLKEEAALFHQCKCGCLIEFLRGRGCSVEKPPEGAELFPVLHVIPTPQTTLEKRQAAMARARAARKQKIEKQTNDNSNRKES